MQSSSSQQQQLQQTSQQQQQIQPTTQDHPSLQSQQQQQQTTSQGHQQQNGLDEEMEIDEIHVFDPPQEEIQVDLFPQQQQNKQIEPFVFTLTTIDDCVVLLKSAIQNGKIINEEEMKLETLKFIEEEFGGKIIFKLNATNNYDDEEFNQNSDPEDDQNSVVADSNYEEDRDRDFVVGSDDESIASVDDEHDLSDSENDNDDNEANKKNSGGNISNLSEHEFNVLGHNEHENQNLYERAFDQEEEIIGEPLGEFIFCIFKKLNF